MGIIADNVRAVLAGLPPGVELVAAAKTRTPAEIIEAIEAGVGIIGENYVKEARDAFAAVGPKARWHYIGHLQSNKVKKAVEIFDMIETVDSVEIARDIGRRAGAAGKTMPFLIEINSGEEDQKAGVRPAEAEALVRAVAEIPNVALQGLMTMGPFEGEPEDFRPYFKTTRDIFEAVKKRGLPGVEMKYLSMGMSHSYRVAIEEGANLVRLGTILFGPRIYPEAG
jgi:pyridoxal phosphate enzyme (YggS family)